MSKRAQPYLDEQMFCQSINLFMPHSDQVRGRVFSLARGMETLPFGVWIEDIATPQDQDAVTRSFPGLEPSKATRGFKFGASIAGYGVAIAHNSSFTEEFSKEHALSSHPDLLLEDTLQPADLCVWNPYIVRMLVHTYQQYPRHHQLLDKWARDIVKPFRTADNSSETLGVKMGYMLVLDLAKRMIRAQSETDFDAMMKHGFADDEQSLSIWRTASDKFWIEHRPDDAHRR